MPHSAGHAYRRRPQYRLHPICRLSTLHGRARSETKRHRSHYSLGSVLTTVLWIGEYSNGHTFSHCSPLAFCDIWPPLLPVFLPSAILLKALLFLTQIFVVICEYHDCGGQWAVGGPKEIIGKMLPALHNWQESEYEMEWKWRGNANEKGEATIIQQYPQLGQSCQH